MQQSQQCNIISGMLSTASEKDRDNIKVVDNLIISPFLEVKPFACQIWGS